MQLRVLGLLPTPASSAGTRRAVHGQDVSVILCDDLGHQMKLTQLTSFTIHCDSRNAPLEVTLRMSGLEVDLSSDIPHSEAVDALLAEETLRKEQP